MTSLTSNVPRRGFTLTELMIAIAIVAILAAILLPNLVAARRRSELTACEQNLKTIATAIQAYQTDNGGLLPLETADSEAQYLNSAVDSTGVFPQLSPYLAAPPVCPQSAGTYRYAFIGSQVNANGLPGWSVLHQATGLHKGPGLTSLYPMWGVNYSTSGDGLLESP